MLYIPHLMLSHSNTRCPHSHTWSITSTFGSRMELCYNDFPPFSCSPQNLNLLYYTMNLPINILVAIGVSLLILIFWKLHKVIIIILTHFNIPCKHRIKVYFMLGKKGVLLLVQLRKRF